MKKIIFTSFVIFYLGTLSAQKNAPAIIKKLNAIEKELNTALVISKAPGFAIAVVYNNKIIYAKGFGYRDMENKLPVTPNTVFPIGSSTKAFTASLIGMLQDQGKIDLNASPKVYIPELQFYNSEMNAQINIKDLMTHRTGLPRHDAAWKVFSTQSKDTLLAKIAFQEPISPVRTQWRYNNFMYFLQGVLSERLTHKSWGQNIDERLFQPLEMTNSSTSISELKMNKEAAVGYYFENGLTTKTDYYDIAAMEPAGAINSSVIDISKWMSAWLNNGLYDKKQVLPGSFVKEAMSSQMVITGRLPRPLDPSSFMMNYGYGWFVSAYKGHYRVDHGGNIDGFSANVALFPSDKLGIVILTNQNASGLPEIVRNIIADTLFNTVKTNWMEQLEKRVQQQTKQDKPNIISSAKPLINLKAYTGSYLNKAYGAFDVVVENDSLYAKFPLETLWLNPTHPNVFESYYIENKLVKSQSKGRGIIFRTNLKGDVTALEINFEPTISPIVFKRSPLKITNANTASLEAFVGEYSYKNMLFKVLVEDNQLQMTINGKQLVHLLKTKTNQFSVVEKEGFTVSFELQDNKKATVLILHQPNGNFSAHRK